MKKSVFFLTLILSLAACGGASTDNPDPTPTVNNCTESTTPDAYCAAVDAGTPFCDTESAACVSSCLDTASPDAFCATADASQPLCDRASGNCVECREHADCGSGACELAVGLCFSEDLVVTVDGDGGADYTSIEAAVGDVPDGGYGVLVVHELASGPYTIAGGLTIGNGKTIALLAAPGELPIVQGTNHHLSLRVEGTGTSVYVDGLSLSGNTSIDPNDPGLLVDGALAWVERSRIAQNVGGGIVAQNGAQLTLRNCFVGGGGADRPPLTLKGASSEVLYSTFFNSAFAETPAINCPVASTLSLRNSIVVTEGGAMGAEFDCPGSEVRFSASEALLSGSGNVAVGGFPNGSSQEWFVGVVGGDFSLQNQGLTLFAEIAQWQSGDPETDIDGDPRPTTDGSPDYAGADVP